MYRYVNILYHSTSDKSFGNQELIRCCDTFGDNIKAMSSCCSHYIACCLSIEHLDSWIPFPDRFVPGNLCRILYIKQPYLLTFMLLIQLLLCRTPLGYGSHKKWYSAVCICHVRVCMWSLSHDISKKLVWVRNTEASEHGSQPHLSPTPPTPNFTKWGPLIFSVLIYRVTMTKATVAITL